MHFLWVFDERDNAAEENRAPERIHERNPRTVVTQRCQIRCVVHAVHDEAEQGGQLYRLSAWFRVNKVGTGTPTPYLQCEFVAAEGGPREPGLTTTLVNDRCVVIWTVTGPDIPQWANPASSVWSRGR